MKSISVFALAAGASAYTGGGTERPTAAAVAASSTRRTFVSRAAEFAATFAGASSLGWLSGGDVHGSGCMCSKCNSAGQHGPGCTCGSCGFAASFGLGLRPPSANAYERDVGGKDRSADTAALNLQARETNARLEKSGFKLDTKEEEEARLSSALSSLSYMYDSNSAAEKSTAGKGYGGKGTGASLKQGKSPGN